MELLILLGIGLTIGGVALAMDDDDDQIKGDTTADATEGNDDLAGASGDDTIFAKDGLDIIDGNGGDDRLFGQDGEDLLLGGAGNDFLRGGSDSDIIIDAEGSDTLIGDLGHDLIVATNAVDPDVTLQIVRDWIDNDDPDENIQLERDLSAPDTDDDADVIQAGYGDDDVYAGNGDTVSLGAGEDALFLGDWIEPGDEPVVLTDYSPLEDMIVYYYDGSGPTPEITVENTLDELGDEDDALLMADGNVFARIEGAGGLISPHNIRVLERE
ncbi:calcium-binding protein [Leisingera daeponensis]|uniref:calcium-binding protein n=1 Tax=Leisingera daeponensis TaxID=405746 RepID=UPI0003FA9AB5|nr:calcium-binding protein [Leisingera daeponensis]